MSAPVGKEGAKVGRDDVDQLCPVDALASIASKEIDQPVRSRGVGADGVCRTAAIVL